MRQFLFVLAVLLVACRAEAPAPVPATASCAPCVCADAAPAPEALDASVADATYVAAGASASVPPVPPSVPTIPPAPEPRPNLTAGFVVLAITKTEDEAKQFARSFRKAVKNAGGSTRWMALTNVLKLFADPPRAPDWLWAVHISSLTFEEAKGLCAWLATDWLKQGRGRQCMYSEKPVFTNKTEFLDPLTAKVEP